MRMRNTKTFHHALLLNLAVCVGILAMRPAPALAALPLDTNSFSLNGGFPLGLHNDGTVRGNTMVGDFDGDGLLDFVVAGRDPSQSNLEFFRNVGTGADLSPASFARTELTALGSPGFARAVDVDGDGRLDLVLYSAGGGSLTVVRNTTILGGANPVTFAAGIDFATGGSIADVAVADIDADGKPDLVVALSGGTALVLKNTSVAGTIDSGSFGTPVSYPVAANPACLAVGDLDGDGKPEIVVGCGGTGGSVSVLRNLGGTFAPRVDYALDSSFRIRIADMDGDGKPEIVVNNGVIHVMINNTSPGTIDATSFLFHADLQLPTAMGDFTLADLNGDGKPEIVGGGSGRFAGQSGNQGNNWVMVIPNNSTPGNLSAGTFGGVVDYAYAGTPESSGGTVAVADLDNDGKPDIIFVDFSGENIAETDVNLLRNVLATAGTPVITINGVRIDSGLLTATDSAQVALTTSFPGGKLFYTLDGSAPTASSLAYTNAFSVNSGLTIRAIAYTSDNSQSIASGTVQLAFQYSLTATTGGGGSLAALPASGPYTANSVVQLTATPLAGWNFINWTGDASGTNPVVNVTMDRARSIQAVFGSGINPVIVGSGAITTSPAQSVFAYGSTVTLTASPQAGNYFKQWGGVLSGSANPTSLIISSPNQTVAAQFLALPANGFTLQTSITGPGTVTVSPQNNVYTNGQSVTLTAAPAGSFTGWSGDVTGTSNPLVLTPNQSLVIAATFVDSSLLTIVTQPQSQAGLIGGSATLAVAASGAALNYQWLKNGAAIPGATNATLTLNNLQATDAASYLAVVSNAAGSVSSQAAALTLVTLTTLPQSQTVNVGANVTFSVAVAGASVSYQWKKNGAAISGATAATLTLNNAQFADAGNYTATISGSFGSATTPIAALKLIVPPGVQGYSFTTFAGLAGAQGSADGPGASARFFLPIALAMDGAGNLYVTEFSNQTVRKITPAGVVSTLAGLAGSAGSADGTGSSARFDSPVGIAVDAAGNLYVSDYYNNTVRKITPGNSVTTLAGQAPVAGSADGLGAAARFNRPWGIALDSGGNLYVADRLNHEIRKITSAGLVSSFAGLAGVAGSADGVGSNARFNEPMGVAVDGSGTVYVCEFGNSTIRKIAADGTVSAFAGAAGAPGTADGVGAAARFNQPLGVALDGAGALYVADTFNSLIRRIAVDGTVTTLAGQSGSGSSDGVAGAARFNQPNGIVADAAGNIYVADTGNHTIRAGVTLGARITSAPQSQAVGVGATVTFAVSASGAGALTYQWQFNGVNLPGATGSSLTLNNVQAASAGVYTVIVDDGSNFASSAAAVLTLSLPAIATQPQNQTAPVGGSATFTVVANGASLSYQWLKNGTGIPGAIGASLTLSNAQPSDAASYAVVVSNSGGSVTSQNATLTVVAPPVFTLQPQSQSVNAGAAATFTVAASGTAPSYQWYKNGTVIAGATSPTLALAAAQVADAAAYLAVASNSAGSVTSSVATLTVVIAPAITAQPQSQRLATGASATFSVTASGVPVNYQWKKNGVTLVGATSSSLTLANVQWPDAAAYSVVVTNSAGAVTSASAQLTVILPPGVGVDSFTTLAGGSAAGSRDGAGSVARFAQPAGITVDGSGNIYVADNLNDTIRKITPDGTVSALAGQPGVSGSADGVGSGATFNRPSGIAIDSGGNLYVADALSHTIRKVTAAGGVSTLAGQPGVAGSANGTGSGASFNFPLGVGVDSAGNVYVADSGNAIIRKITPGGVVTTLAGQAGVTGTTDGSGSAARFIQPTSLAVDSAGNLFVADQSNPLLRKVTPAGVVTTTRIALGQNGVLCVDGAGNVFVADTSDGTVRETTLAGVLSTLGGLAGNFVGGDGVGSNARFNGFGGIAVDGADHLYLTTVNLVKTGVPIAPPVTSPPQDQNVVAGSSATFSVAASWPTAVTYQWQFNGVNLPGATGTTFTVINAQLANAGVYEVIVDGGGGYASSATATLSVGAAAVAPVITSQPQSQTVTAGDNVSFSVSAGGTSPLSYQWQFNGGAIPGATSATFSLSNAQAPNAGAYTALVSNTAGSVTSAAATLTVNPVAVAPAITVQPSNQTATAGGSVGFSVTASGTSPLTYQWQFNGATLPGATSQSLTLNNVQSANAGTYTVVVSNTAGSVTSVAATLTVNQAVTPPAITGQPLSQTVAVGAMVMFTVTATGSAPTYQWLKNGTGIPGATGATLTLNAVQLSDAGSYTVVVSNSGGAAISSAATLTVNPAIIAPAITTQPASQTVLPGASVTFSVVATGTAPSYQWQKNGAAINGATSPSLTINNAQVADAATYTVVVSNTAGAVTSAPATLAVSSTTVAPTITSGPQSQTVTAGANVTFSVVANGSSPNFQWQKNGVGITGATSATLTLNNVQAADAAAYTVTVSNTAGSVTSAAASLTVNPAPTAPSITTAPQSQTVAVGANVTFTVAASGTSPAYQWQKDGVNIPGATDATLSLNGVQLAGAGSYAVIVTNVAGSVTSAAAVLTVLTPPTISNSPANQTAGVGGSVTFTVTASGSSLSYQWQKNGANLNGASGPSLTLNNLQPSDAGSYAVVVSNLAGAVTSATGVLTVATPVTISQAPVSQTVIAGGKVTFSVTADGSALSYQWQKNGTNIIGATGLAFTIEGVQESDDGVYAVVVSNAIGALTSAAATLTVLTPVTIVTPPVNQTVIAGTNVNLTVTATGTAPLSYRWQFNGADLTGATNATLALNNVQPGAAGSYAVIVGNTVGSVTSAAATLVVLAPPTIATPPRGTDVALGANVTLSVAATGTAPLSYRWLFNSSPVLSATNATLSLLNLQLSDSGAYVVVVSNPAGSVTSAPAIVTVHQPPRITSQPQGSTNFTGESVVLSVRVDGETPFSFQWQFNGVALPDKTDDHILLSPLLESNGGIYTVVVSNAYGSVTSQGAILKVNPRLVANPPATPGSNKITLSLAGNPGETYQVQASDDLTHWTTVAILTIVNGVATYTDTAGPGTQQRFYRLIMP